MQAAHSEVIGIDGLGRDVFARTSARAVMRAVCACGRERFAEPKHVHQIWGCRVCMAAARAAEKAAKATKAKRLRALRAQPVRQSRSKLSEVDVQTARRMRDDGATLLEIAIDLGVDPSTIHRVLKRTAVPA